MQTAREIYLQANLTEAVSSRQASWKKPLKRKRQKYRWLFLASFIIFSLVLIRVYQQTLINQVSMQIATSKLKLERQRKIRKDLTNKIMALEAPGRVERIAKNNLGMTNPTKVFYLIVTDNSFRAYRSQEEPLTERQIQRTENLISSRNLWR